jgi:hypothetical protein
MGKEEQNIVPGPVAIEDDLWVTEGALNDTLRIDPVNNWPQGDPGIDGLVFEIDYIRIREDLRWEFNNGDPEGIDQYLGIDPETVAVQDGFLRYEVGGEVAGDPGDPYFFRVRNTGLLATEYFTQVCLGFDNPQVFNPEGEVAVYFDDADSVGYLSRVLRPPGTFNR